MQTDGHKTTPLRVLIAADSVSARFGGESILPLHYFRRLRRRGVDAWLVCHERTRSELTEVLGDDISRVRFIEDSWLARRACRLIRRRFSSLVGLVLGSFIGASTRRRQRRLVRQVVAEEQIDLVHEPMPVSPKRPSSLHKVGAPVIIGPMNGGMSYPPAFRSMQSRAVRLAVPIGRFIAEIGNLLSPGKRRAALLLAANQRTVDALPRVCRHTSTQILVENGVDLSMWPERNNGKDRADDGPLRLAYVGRLVDWKAVDLLIDAVAAVVSDTGNAEEKTRSVELHIIGDGPERAALQNRAASRHVGTIVRFHGFVPQHECGQLLGDMDCLVLPSLYECGGAVVLEAMACGLPVIATRWGGPADYLDETCGILVEPGSPAQFVDDLAAAMKRMADDPALRRQMGCAGREKICRDFDWERKVDRIIDLYHGVCRTENRADAVGPIDSTTRSGRPQLLNR